MEHSYLNSWRDFKNHSKEIVSSQFDRLIEEENTAEGLLKGLMALSACKLESRQ
jgi:hypothetical protein